MRTTSTIICLLFFISSYAQQLPSLLDAGLKQLERDEQFKHSILSMYVEETGTDKIVYQRMPEVGLSPASCQKVITSITAFELLGKDFQYHTKVSFAGDKNQAINLSFETDGDPTMGSFRYASTTEEKFMTKLNTALRQKGIKSVSNNFNFIDNINSVNEIPAGWVWEDVANYYGATASSINWRENQYDIIFNPGSKENDDTKIKSIEPSYTNIVFNNQCKTGKKGSGDKSFIFFGNNSNEATVRGTLPLGENNFKVSGAVRNSKQFFKNAIMNFLQENNFQIVDDSLKSNETSQLLFEHISPSLDSINYWFLKKSVNLYGEAFVRSIAFKKTNIASTDSGVQVIRNFWKDHGVETSSTKILDGSGLSPSNRITCKALVDIMQYAKRQNWFSSFYNALPEMNGIRMKDGYMSGVRSYTGYIKSSNGKEYTFAFIVNNFDGSPATARQKMWNILNILK